MLFAENPLPCGIRVVLLQLQIERAGDDHHVDAEPLSTIVLGLAGAGLFFYLLYGVARAAVECMMG